MANRYLVVSDLHLCDVEDHTDGWMWHKGSRYLFDHEFGELVRSFVAEKNDGDRLTLVLNGDILDFDLITAVPEEAPWPVDGSERLRGLAPTEPKSLWKLEYVLSFHSQFVDVLAEFLVDGHQIVYVLGNHDRELHFPLVRAAFTGALRRSARALFDRDIPEDSIRFEPWFFAVPGEIYVEHGQQYDTYTAFRHVLSPTVTMEGEEQIAIPMGNLSNRYLMSRMGFFNPHSSDFILNVFSYFEHWLTHYAFTGRSLALLWLWGSFAVMARLLKLKRHLLAHAPDLPSSLRKLADRSRLPLSTLEALYQLQAPPITGRFFRIVREFWLDRLLLGLLTVAGTVVLWSAGLALWLDVTIPLLGVPLAFFVYERFAQGETIFSIEEKLPRRARDICDVLPVKVVAFGHTHVPRMVPLAKDVTMVDTGAWAPVSRKKAPGRLAPGFRNYLLLSFDRGRPLVTFGSWLPAQETQEAQRAPVPTPARIMGPRDVPVVGFAETPQPHREGYLASPSSDVGQTGASS